jgi:hypothetical protein
MKLQISHTISTSLRIRLPGLILLLLAAIGQAACQTETAGPSEAVPATYFGLHIHKFPVRDNEHARAFTAGPSRPNASAPTWPDIPFGSWRLWDAGVAWFELEPQKGVWNFARLDSAVELAATHHVDVLLTLGLTPAWASSRPHEAAGYKPGNAAPPTNMADWEDYVRTVATRYKGRIHAYEIWNEPNLAINFTGDPATMAEMTRRAAVILRQVDPNCIVVSASVTGRYGLQWLDKYLTYGAGNYVDVIGYHLYVTPDPAERMLPLAVSIRQIMAAHGLASKPLWNTESGWAKPKTFVSNEEAAAYLSRAYILNWLGGVKRFYWYAWDNYWWVTLMTTDPETRRPTSAAAGYATTERWTTGAILRSCTSDSQDVWSCRLDRDGASSWIVWRPEGTMSFRLLPTMGNVHQATSLEGKVSRVQGGLVAVGISPQLLTP